MAAVRRAEPLVTLERVVCGYNGPPVLQDLSLALYPGQLAGVVGPSGAGKTTLLRAILGLLPIREGRVRVLGRDPRGAPEGVAYVPQIETVDWNFPVTVEEVVLMGLPGGSPWPWPRRADRRAVRDLLERLGIGGLAARHIRDLSGGQQQRVFLARALVRRPRLLVLDEPTSGVDIKTRHDILHLLGDLNREGVTILMTTHDLNSVATHLPWVICLNRRVIAEGPPREVFTPAILAHTYQAEMVVVQHEGLTLIADRLGALADHSEARPPAGSRL